MSLEDLNGIKAPWWQVTCWVNLSSPLPGLLILCCSTLRPDAISSLDAGQALGVHVDFWVQPLPFEALGGPGLPAELLLSQ